MQEKLDIFRLSHAMAVHAGTRQALLAQNIANADTPGYKARDIAPFRDLVKPPRDTTDLRATRTSHLNGAGSLANPQFAAVRNGSDSPNGNTVSLEEEMMKAVEVMRQHDRAIAIYKSSLGILRTSLGRR